MSEYNRSAEKRIDELASEAVGDFETAIMHNLVYETVDGQRDRNNELIRTLDLAESAYDLSDETETDDLDSAAFEAANALDDVVDALVDQQIAIACAEIITEGDDWTDTWDAEDVDAAQHEAREWLQTHQDAAERVSVLEEVADVE
jgi:beta-galactosidase GanA